MNRKNFFQCRSGVSPSNEINIRRVSLHTCPHCSSSSLTSAKILHHTIEPSGQIISPFPTDFTNSITLMESLRSSNHVGVDASISLQSLFRKNRKASKIKISNTTFSLYPTFTIILHHLCGGLMIGIASSGISLGRWICVLKKNFRFRYKFPDRISFYKKTSQCSPKSFYLSMKGGC